MFQPCVGMVVEKKYIEKIAEVPFVYCIRVIPPMEPCPVTIDEARWINRISYVQANNDPNIGSSVDVAIIDTGYDVNEDELTPEIGEAEDNIAFTWDFAFDDSDVSDGDNSHGTTCLDLLARALGDEGEDDSMYQDPSIYYVLKVRWYFGILLQGAIREAIEWCISNDMEIVSMSFGSGPYDACPGWWCELFKIGAYSGIVWIAAAGNHYSRYKVAYPACSFWVIGVGAYKTYYYERIGTTYVRQVERADFSNYGWIDYTNCEYCRDGENMYGDGDNRQFKPEIYDAGIISEEKLIEGTSYATPIAAAAIAVGVFSPTSAYQKFSSLADFVELKNVLKNCDYWYVIPSESSRYGDVIDAKNYMMRLVANIRQVNIVELLKPNIEKFALLLFLMIIAGSFFCGTDTYGYIQPATVPDKLWVSPLMFPTVLLPLPVTYRIKLVIALLPPLGVGFTASYAAMVPICNENIMLVTYIWFSNIPYWYLLTCLLHRMSRRTPKTQMICTLKML